MQLTVDIGFDQLVQLAKRLPKTQWKRLKDEVDLFRKTNKENSLLVSLIRQGYSYSISAITEYEIYTGAVLGQIDYWNALLQKTPVIAFDNEVAKVAIALNKQFKQKRKLIDTADLFIAATAVKNELPLATLK